MEVPSSSPGRPGYCFPGWGRSSSLGRTIYFFQPLSQAPLPPSASRGTDGHRDGRSLPAVKSDETPRLSVQPDRKGVTRRPDASSSPVMEERPRATPAPFAATPKAIRDVSKCKPRPLSISPPTPAALSHRPPALFITQYVQQRVVGQILRSANGVHTLQQEGAANGGNGLPGQALCISSRAICQHRNGCRNQTAPGRTPRPRHWETMRMTRPGWRSMKRGRRGPQPVY